MALRFKQTLASFGCFLLVITIAAKGSTRQSGQAIASQSRGDTALQSVRRADTSSRDANGKLARLPAAEHLRRANVYMTNRAFAEAREHWQAVLDYYPQDPGIPEALLGIGRSYFQSRKYADAFSVFDRLSRDYALTKEGREGLNFSASALLRLGRFSEAVNRYTQYIERYPTGERIESAHLNVIDSLREDGRPQEALGWIARTKQRFANTPTETNAVFAELRLHIAGNNWRAAIATADQLLRMRFQKEVDTTPSEVAYLRAYSFEQMGRKSDAFAAYANVPDGINAYYGWLATQRMAALASPSQRTVVEDRLRSVSSAIANSESQYPTPYRQAILKSARSRGLDPRFVLALMRQESVFSPSAKSPSGARGLLQLTIDAAQKYAVSAGMPNVRESQLYQPEASIRLGVEYLAQLSKMFPRLLEPVAASYNGGEDNVARWVKRAKQQDPGVFTAEVGFDETKSYVQKVMANYRVYTELYTPDLLPK